MNRVRRVPERMCVACRTRRPKRELVRVVRSPAGHVLIDPTGKQAGRGAYVCPDEDCLRRAIKNKSLERALEIQTDAGLLAELTRQIHIVAKTSHGGE